MRYTLYLLSIGVSTLSLAGCTQPLTNGAPQMVRVEDAHPISVEPQVSTLVVRVDDGLQRLARGEDRRIEVFAAGWKARGQGLLTAAVPTESANGVAAAAAMQDVKRVLAASGIDANSVQFTTYRAPADDPNAPITLSFVSYAAVAAECGRDWTENMAYTPRNLPWPEFGCSTQHNLAAIVSDPRDLIEPRASEPADAARRGTVFDKYRAGEPTQTKAVKDNKGEVSTVGQ